jgi:amidase
VDGVLYPVAPFPAARPAQYDYYGYSVWVNCLDSTAVVVLVTTVDKEIDKVDSNFESANETDKAVHQSCK